KTFMHCVKPCLSERDLLRWQAVGALLPGAHRVVDSAPAKPYACDASQIGPFVDSGGGVTADSQLAILVSASDRPGSLHQLTRVIWEHHANVCYSGVTPSPNGVARMYFELEAVDDADALIADIAALDVVDSVAPT